jgi:hypothetical protein
VKKARNVWSLVGELLQAAYDHQLNVEIRDDFISDKKRGINVPKSKESHCDYV